MAPGVQTADVVIIGGGVVGCAIAARLSVTAVSVVLIEATGDVANGASKANAGVAVSHYGETATLETDLVSASNPRWEDLCHRLDVPYRRIGAIMVALSDAEQARLEQLHAALGALDVRSVPLTAGEARAAEPLISDQVVSALSLPDEGIIDPVRLTVAYASLAALNGTQIVLGEPVVGIESAPQRTIVRTARRSLAARFVVNAAGLGTGEISALAGGEPLVMWPRRGEYLVLDREFGRRMRHIVFGTSLPDAKGVNVTPTTHGTVLVGPSSADTQEPSARVTHTETIDAVLASAQRLVPAIDRRWAIKLFAGSRPASDERFRLRFDAMVPALLHAGSRSSGVSTSPALADHAVTLLRGAGLEAPDRPAAHRMLKPTPRLRTVEHPESLLALDPGYGQVVCACEQVTAAEIQAALEGPVPARSIEGVRKRTGATYGRCQGAICMVGVGFMCANRHGDSPNQVLVNDGGTVGTVR
jgi:glycerol-3-phosphate dehydrogenase